MESIGRGRDPSIAVVGCGRWGRNLARTFAGLGVLAAVVDTDGEAAAREAGVHAVPALGLEAALGSERVSAVAIAAPAVLHAELCLAALAAGKDVYVEKPFATSMPEARRVAARARGSDRVLMVGHLMQYHSAFEALLALVKGGRIGPIRYATAARANLGRARTEEDALFSLAPHDISMLLALFGEAPEAVAASGCSFITPGVADAAWTELSFSSGRQARVFSAWLAPSKEQRLVVVGETGMATFDDLKPWSQKLELRSYSVQTTPHGPVLEGGAPESLAIEADEPLRRECAHFIACCRDRAPPRTGLDEALAVQAVLTQAQAAMRAANPSPPLQAVATGYRA